MYAEAHDLWRSFIRLLGAKTAFEDAEISNPINDAMA